MRFFAAVSCALLAVAMASPAAQPAPDVDAGDIADAVCPCYPNCGCPSGTSCTCRVPTGAFTRPSCYLNRSCGCSDDSPICVVSRLKSLPSLLDDDDDHHHHHQEVVNLVFV